MASSAATFSVGCSRKSNTEANRPMIRNRMPLTLIRPGDVRFFIDDRGGISMQIFRVQPPTTNNQRFFVSLRVQLRQLRGGLFPFGGQALKVLHDGTEV